MTTHGRSSCTSILIGKKASLDGSVIIGRNEDSRTAWPKHLPSTSGKQEPRLSSHMITSSQLICQRRPLHIHPLQNGRKSTGFLKKTGSMSTMWQ